MSLYDSPSSIAGFLAKAQGPDPVIPVVDTAESSVASITSPPSAAQETIQPAAMDHGRTLHDSMFAANTLARPISARKPSGKNLLDAESSPSPMTPTQRVLLDLTNGNGTRNGSTDAAAEVARSPGSTMEGRGSWQDVETATSNQATNESQDESMITHESGVESQIMPSPPAMTPVMTPVSSPAVSKFKPQISISSPVISPTPTTVHGEPSTGTPDANSIVLKHATDILASKIAVVKIESKQEGKHEEAKKVADDDANREHAVYFSAWGTPETRTKQKSCTRKVILSGLPGNVDFTFVQALVHGGAIEDMTLNATSGVAYVLFTTGSACDKYADTYPNGIEFKHKGRKLTIFVDKGKDVDVISSMSEAYLAAGASRVVKACNVDEDWSMRALRHIAEGGPKQKRKVEYISDDFRNEVRNVTFRFVNIAEAVSFHNTLRRSDEWEAAEIQFGADPCEKAEGFHFE